MVVRLGGPNIVGSRHTLPKNARRKLVLYRTEDSCVARRNFNHLYRQVGNRLR